MTIQKMCSSIYILPKVPQLSPFFYERVLDDLFAIVDIYCYENLPILNCMAMLRPEK